MTDTPTDPDWTDEERERLTYEEYLAGLEEEWERDQRAMTWEEKQNNSYFGPNYGN